MASVFSLARIGVKKIFFCAGLKQIPKSMPYREVGVYMLYDFFRFKNSGLGPVVPLCFMLAACLPGKSPEIRPEGEAIERDIIKRAAVERENPERMAGEGEILSAALGPAGSYTHALEELAETERSGGFSPGMALTESMLREWSGDYGGAVIAAYKELSWAYGYGSQVTRADMEEGLRAVVNLYEGGRGNSALDNPALGEDVREQALRAARGVLAFHNGLWTEARLNLEPLFDDSEEPDAFAQWMRLVCRLEEREASRGALAAYGAIRARYERFPEYWYRGARYVSGNIRGEYAERCINLAPQGPFAEDCRGFLAEIVGLSHSEGSYIKTRAEIEETITRSVASGTPEILTELFTLLSLQDNPYTLYTAGAMRALAIQEDFKTWFTREAAQTSGRLAERLFYISRG